MKHNFGYFDFYFHPPWFYLSQNCPQLKVKNSTLCHHETSKKDMCACVKVLVDKWQSQSPVNAQQLRYLLQLQ